MIIDHSGQSEWLASTCSELPNANATKVNQQLQVGKEMGMFSSMNTCQSFASDVIRKSRIRPIEYDSIIPEYSGY